jgi:hypothetical protein
MLAGADKVIRIETCESTQTNDLLRTLGYRMRGGCGSEVVLETVNAPRAFITTDSGFPLAELEAALRTDKPFSYDYHPSQATVLYTAGLLAECAGKDPGRFHRRLSERPGLCRFYLGMSKLDPETAEDLKNSISPTRLRALRQRAGFLRRQLRDPAGESMIVPGGAKSAGAWGDLAGASPDKGAEFFEKLLIKDDGWLASLYDALGRIHGPVEDYLTDPARMKRFYTAVRGRVTTPGPARPVFQSNTDMMLLTTRLHVDFDGRVHIPGGLDVWRDVFQRNPRGKYDAKLSKAAAGWKEPDDVVEALFALCRKPVDNEPLKIFMALSDLDRNRAQPLKPETVQRLIRGSPVSAPNMRFSTTRPGSATGPLSRGWTTPEALDKIHDSLFRQDAIGTVQGLTGIWQIFCRQGSIPADKADETLLALTMPFATVRSTRDLFDAGRSGVNALLKSTGVSGGSAQDRMLALLAGGPRTDDSESRAELVQQEQRIFEAQKLLPVDLLFDMADNLQAVSKGEKLNAQLPRDWPPAWPISSCREAR